MALFERRDLVYQRCGCRCRYIWFQDKDKLDSIPDDEDHKASRDALKDRMDTWQIYAIVATVVAVSVRRG